jgi:hypothetical protein
MSRRYVVLAFILLLAAAVAVPALGQSSEPTATSAASAKKKAKKALRVAKEASAAANTAQAHADSAQADADLARSTANTVNNLTGGVAQRRINYVRTSADATQTTVLSLRGLQILVDCAAGPNAVAGTTVNNAFIQSASMDPDSETVKNGATDQDFNVGDTEDLLPDEVNTVGHTEYLNPNGQQVTVHWQGSVGTGGFPDPTCFFTGYAHASG